MSKSKDEGAIGEQEVITLVKCPNCGKKLMGLPKNYPLFDIQCTACSFRAQVKTNNAKPKGEVFGAGWDIIEKVLKSGHMVPPLIVNFKWNHKGKSYQTILFYPFVPKDYLKKRVLSPTARRANYKMFNYIGLDKLPHFILYDSERV